ncbi:MAG: flagellar hook assembly protein FlgD [Flavobacteriales bacterium]|jgi:flagellar hook assembly protein FlgD
MQATKEQQAIILNSEEKISELAYNNDELQYQLNQMSEQLNSLIAVVNACCDSDLKNMELENDIQINPEKSNELNQNAPNPFMETTKISCTLAQDALATVKIYNSYGQVIDTFVSKTQNEGNHSIQWNANGMAAGIYFYSLEINNVEQVRRMVKL